VRARFGRWCCRETLRTALHRLGLSWKKARKLLGRADPERRAAFLDQLRPVLDGAQRDRHVLVYLDAAHIHQDVDLGYGWGERGKRFHVASCSPGLAAKVSLYGLYFYNEGQVRLWPYARAHGEHTIDVLHRLRTEFPNGALVVIWDGAPYHRSRAVQAAATNLGITPMPLPGYSPDLMPVEPLWRWLREDVTYHHCHATTEDLTRRVAAFEANANQDPYTVADRLWVKDRLDPDEEKLRFSSQTRFSSAQYSQCVAARRSSSIPEAASRNAPVQTEATRRACLARSRTQIDEHRVRGRRFTPSSPANMSIQRCSDRRERACYQFKPSGGGHAPAALRYDPQRVRRRSAC
jgi:hypothetical protein